MKLFRILLLSLSVISFGQNKKIDSLKNELTKEPKNVKVLLELSKEFDVVDSKKAIEFSKQAIRYSKNNDKQLAESYYSLGVNYFMSNNNKDALANYNLALELSKKNNDLKCSIYTDISNVYSQKRDTKTALLYLDKAQEIIKNETEIEDILRKKMRLHLLKASLYEDLNNFEFAFDNANEAFKLSIKLKDKKRQLRILNTIANIYDSKGERKKAIEIYLDIISKIEDNIDTKQNISVWFYNLASTYLKIDDLDNAKEYLNKASQILIEFPEDKMQAFISVANAQIFLLEKKYSLGLLALNKAEKLFRLNEIEGRISDCYYWKSKIYIEKKDFKRAEENILAALKIYKSFDLKNEQKDCYEILSEIKVKQLDYENALFYYKKHKEINDSIYGEQKISAISSAEIKYETELKEAKIKQQQLELQKEKMNKYLAFGIIGLLFLISISGFWVFKNKQKQNNLQTQNTLLSLQQNLNNMELQNLNQQLDPHEIKNLLASISPEIQEKAPDSYKKMLKLFNITKASLNSNSITESIENQVQQVDDFLSLEINTILVPLEYEIVNDTKDSTIQIPRLMLKNLIENAVKHGIKGNDKGGKIKVELQEKDNFILIAIDDTGKGRGHNVFIDNGIGISTYQKLFTTLNKINKEKATFEIIDKQQGTIVEVKIPIDYKYS